MKILLSPMLLVSLLFAGSVMATVPGEVSFQGLLTDSGGTPITGTADFVFTLFDLPSAGTSSWTESHDDVEVTDGVYDVVLGSLTPLTPTLFAAGAPYLEIQVDGEILTPRQRLIAVPFALRAEEADNALAVGGVDSTFVEQIFESFAFDGGNPPNDDPREGFGDQDNDSIPNFIDPDNDNDQVPDTAELADGSDINAPTPKINSLTPSIVPSHVPVNIQVGGSTFDPAMSAVFDGAPVTLQNLTATSFDFDITPVNPGMIDLSVLNPNGENDTEPLQVDFVLPDITGLSPAPVPSHVPVTIQVTGTGFLPGMTALFDGAPATPLNLTPTSFDVDINPQNPGMIDLSVLNPNGQSDSEALQVDLVLPDITSLTPSSVPSHVPVTVQVIGTGFLSGMTALFDGAPATPLNLTPTSFDVDINPQNPGMIDIVAQNPSGQSDSEPLQVNLVVPVINSFFPAIHPANVMATLTINGSGFLPGAIVDFGTQTLVPTSLSPTSIDVTVAAEPIGTYLVTVTNPSGESDTQSIDTASIRTVFVSATDLQGDFGGIAGADAMCAAEASSAALPGTFLAWLSDGSTDPASRFTTEGSFHLVDGTTVASNFAELTSGSLPAPINKTASGIAVSKQVWTGTLSAGQASGLDCSDWTSTGGNGTAGLSSSTSLFWTSVTSLSCTSSARLYCFQQ